MEDDEKYYEIQKYGSLLQELNYARNHPVLGLEDIAEIIKKVLDKAEIESLIKSLI